MLQTSRLVFLSFVALFAAEKAAAQRIDWATLLGGAASEVGYSVATDFDGSVVVAGLFEGATNIGGGQLSSDGYSDVFVAKFSSGGGLMWLNRIGGISTDQPAAAAIDMETGDVVVTGRFSARATVDNHVLQGAGSTDVFVVRYSKSGSLQWALAFGGSEPDDAAGVAVDPNGDSLVTGQFSGTFTCGSTTLTSVGATDIFVANVASDGAVRWCRRYGGPVDDEVDGIAVGNTGLFALTGGFGSTTDLGGGSLISAGEFDGFVAAYAVSNGDYRWARGLGGSGYDAGNSVAFDPTGAVVVTGYFGLFDGGVDFGGGVLVTEGGADAFVAKYDGGDGRYIWASKFGGKLDDYGNAVSVSQTGEVAIAGEFQGDASFAGIAGASGGQFDAFLAGFSSDGAPLWWRAYGDIVNDKAHGVAVDFEGNYFVTGFSVYRIDLGKGPLYSAGMSDAFLAKLAPAVVRTPTPTRTFTPTAVPPTATRTFTPTAIPPTATRTFTPTAIPPTATHTFTQTALPPTATRTFTATAVPPTATRTFTSTTVPPTATQTFTPTVVPSRPTRTFTAWPSSTPTGGARACAVDCNDDGAVTVDELLVGINIVLGQTALSRCAISDSNDDGMVTINEVVTAVRSALTECP